MVLGCLVRPTITLRPPSLLAWGREVSRSVLVSTERPRRQLLANTATRRPTSTCRSTATHYRPTFQVSSSVYTAWIVCRKLYQWCHFLLSHVEGTPILGCFASVCVCVCDSVWQKWNSSLIHLCAKKFCWKYHKKIVYYYVHVAWQAYGMAGTLHLHAAASD